MLFHYRLSEWPIPRQAKAERATPAGRSCKLCGSKDTDKDMVFPCLFIKWAKPVRNGKNQGMICHYCWKTYQGRFAITYTKFDLLVDTVGKDNDVKSKFNHYRGCAIRGMKEARSWGSRTYWSQAEQEHKTLTHHKESLMQLIGPDRKARRGPQGRPGAPGPSRRWLGGGWPALCTPLTRQSRQ